MERLAGVMVQGSWYPEAELQGKLDAIAEKHAQLKANAKGPDKAVEAGQNKP